MGGAKELVNVGGDKIGDVGVDGDGGVEERDLAAGGFGLGEGLEGVGLVEEDLALEVGGLDEVAVDEGEGADAGSGEERGCCCSGGSAADDGDVRGGELALALGSDAGEEDLTGVAVVVVNGDVRGGWTGGGNDGSGAELLRRLRHGWLLVSGKTLLFRSIGNARMCRGVGQTCQRLPAS